MSTKNKVKQVAIRLADEEWNKLLAVQESIAKASRGQKPDIVQIIRSLLFGENPDLLSEDEVAFLHGKIDSIHGPYLPIPKSDTGGSRAAKGKGK